MSGCEPRPVPGSAYSVGTVPNAGQPANVHCERHYPIEANCAGGCGGMIRAVPGDPVTWEHTGRKRGAPREP